MRLRATEGETGAPGLLLRFRFVIKVLLKGRFHRDRGGIFGYSTRFGFKLEV